MMTMRMVMMGLRGRSPVRWAWGVCSRESLIWLGQRGNSDVSTIRINRWALLFYCTILNLRVVKIHIQINRLIIIKVEDLYNNFINSSLLFLTKLRIRFLILIRPTKNKVSEIYIISKIKIYIVFYIVIVFPKQSFLSFTNEIDYH